MPTLTPPPIGAYAWNGTGWVPLTASGSGTPLEFTPPPAALYVFTSGQWIPLGGSGSNPLSSTPPPVGLYVNPGTGWIPCATGGSSGAPLSSIPPPVSAYVNSGSGWVPLATGGTGSPLPSIPPPVALYALSSGGWIPWTGETSGVIEGWPMNEGSGLILHDTIGGNTATISAGAAVTWQANAGLPGTTPLWNGSGSALSASATLTNFTGTLPFSLSVWAAPTFDGATLMSTLDVANGFKGWELSIISGAVHFFLVNTFPANAIQAAGSTLLLGNGLHYIVATYDGSQTVAGVNFYIDGVLDATNIATDTLSASAANGLPVRFGARNDGSEELSGPMAFAEIYNRVLTSIEVAANFAAGPGIR